MTKPFTAPQKLRILVHHGAMVLDAGAWVPIGQYRFGTMNRVKRFKILQRVGCAVKCACGCGVWAPLPDIQFDHEHQHALGGATVISNGRPLRTDPCHRAKSAAENTLIADCDRIGRKFRVRSKDEIAAERATTPRWHRSFPSRRFPAATRALAARRFPTRRETLP
jgi:hypothetical protein